MAHDRAKIAYFLFALLLAPFECRADRVDELKNKVVTAFVVTLNPGDAVVIEPGRPAAERAVTELIDIGNQRALDALLELYQHPEFEVRWAVMSALTNPAMSTAKKEKAAKVLIHFLYHGESSDKSTVPQLVGRLAELGSVVGLPVVVAEARNMIRKATADFSFASYVDDIFRSISRTYGLSNPQVHRLLTEAIEHSAPYIAAAALHQYWPSQTVQDPPPVKRYIELLRVPGLGYELGEGYQYYTQSEQQMIRKAIAAALRSNDSLIVENAINFFSGGPFALTGSHGRDFDALEQLQEILNRPEMAPIHDRAREQIANITSWFQSRVGQVEEIRSHASYYRESGNQRRLSDCEKFLSDIARFQQAQAGR